MINLLMILIVTTTINALPILFDTADVFTPDYVTCIHPDVYGLFNRTSDCDVYQSDGCNTDSTFCILTSAFHYSNNTPVYNITTTPTSVWAASQPNLNDGKVEVCIVFAFIDRAPLQGTLQLWYYSYSTNNNDVYAFNYSQVVIYNYAASSTPQCYLFHGLKGNLNWVPVFWPIGGTRYGQGYPEIGNVFNIATVLPNSKAITLQYIQPNPSAGTLSCTDYTPGFAKVGYKISGFIGIETYLLRAANPPYNRNVVIEIHTPWGNTVDVYINPYSESSGNFELCYYVMNTGGFFSNEGNMLSPPALRYSISAKLSYIGLPGSTYAYTWQNRQVTGYYSIIALRFLDVVQTEVPDSTATTYEKAVAQGCLGTTYYMKNNSYMITNVGPRTDRVMLWWLRWISNYCDDNGVVDPTFGWDHTLNSLGRGTNVGTAFQNGFTLHDWASKFMFPDTGGTGNGITGTSGPTAPLYYKEYSNDIYNLDLPCKVTGSAYATANVADNIKPSVNCFTAFGVGYIQYPAFRFGNLTDGSACYERWQPDGTPVCQNVPYILDTHDTIGGPTVNCDCCNAINDEAGFNNLCHSDQTIYSEYGVGGYSLDEIFNNGLVYSTSRDKSTYCQTAPTKNIFSLLPGAEDILYFPSCQGLQAPYYQVSGEIVTGWGNLDTTTEYLLINVMVGQTCSSSPSLPMPTAPVIWNYGAGITGQVPPDAGFPSVRYSLTLDGNLRATLGSTTMMNPMYQKYPMIEVYDFRNSLVGQNGQPDTIEMSFAIYCDAVGTGRTTYQAYCAEQMTLVYASTPSTSAILQFIIGPMESTIAWYNPFSVGTVLGGVTNYTYYRVRLNYIQDDLILRMFRRSVPESPIGVSFCESLSDVIATPPSKGLIWKPLIADAIVGQKECPYSTPSMGVRAKRGFPWIYENIIELNYAATAGFGYSESAENDISYYYNWLLNATSVAEGYAQSTQLFEIGSTVQVYDRVSNVYIGNIPFEQSLPENPNPLLREPSCLETDIISDTCLVTPYPNSYAYAGINQYPIYDPSTVANPIYTMLTPRLTLQFPFTQFNLRSWFFNLTTEFIDIYIVSLEIAGIDAQQEFQAVYATSLWTLFVSYGHYTGQVQVTPCWERMISQVNVLSEFSINIYSVTPLQYCNATASCCYQLNYQVTGNSPTSGAFINFDNTTDSCYNSGGSCSGSVNCNDQLDPCYNTCPCRYQFTTSPPLAVGGGYCLGGTYTITVQNRQGDVAIRDMPQGYPIPNTLAYRKPITVTYQIPHLGISPVNVVVYPGSCNNRGNKFDVTFTINNPACSGPVIASNSNPICAFNLYFALVSANNPTYPGPTPTNGFLIRGSHLFSYNFENNFIWPDVNGPNQLAIPNGYWTVYVWASPPTAPDQGYVNANFAYQQTTNVVASLTNDQSMIIILDAVDRPLCPNDNKPITVYETLYDTQWNGPYTVYVSTPSNRLISVQTLTVFSFPSSNPCCFNSDYDVCVQNCGTAITTTGLPFSFQVGTGIYSAGETGGYNVTIYANASTCYADTYVYLKALDPLVLLVSCLNTTCSNSNNGYLGTSIFGGTPRTIEQQVDYSGGTSGASPFGSPYACNITSPFGDLITCQVFDATVGNYTVYVTDANNCTANASCSIKATSSPIYLQAAGEIPPNCTNLPATVTFTAWGGYGNLTLVRLSNSTIQIINGSYIMTDANAIPGYPQTYAAMDELGCLSAPYLYTAQAAPPFTLDVVIVKYPCTEGQVTGEMTATAAMQYTPVIDWVNIQSGQTVCSNKYDCVTSSGLYQVTAYASFNRNCFATQVVNLYASGFPVITWTRKENSELYENHATGTFTASANSVNGPPFTYSIYPDLPTDPEPFLTFYQGDNQLPGSVTILNLLTSFNFYLTMTDDNSCSKTEQIQGSAPPDTIPPYFPTPLPNTTIVEYGKQVPVNAIVVAIFAVIVMGFVAILVIIKTYSVR
jgi:hypothetical protein